jgi:hypothetical protein
MAGSNVAIDDGAASCGNGQTTDKESEIMIEASKTMPITDQVHLGFNEQRQPLLRGEAHRYLVGRGDQLAFAAEVVRFGFSPTDFALDVERLPGKRSPGSSAATFAVTVEHVFNRRSVTYNGGPGRAWVAEFLRDLIAERFGQP